jgi:aspartate-semialdehyde dehydrogenase
VVTIDVEGRTRGGLPHPRRQPVLGLVGADGDVGAVLDQVLATRDAWGAVHRLQPEQADDFDGLDIVVFVGDRAACVQWAPSAVHRGAVVVDATGAHAGQDDVPLVAPGVNPAQVRDRPRGIVALPRQTTLTAADTLAVLHAGWGLTGVVAASYHAASDVGSRGAVRLREELALVTAEPGLGSAPGDVRRTVDSDLDAFGPFPAPIALNVVPWVGADGDDGWTSVELDLRSQVRALLGRPTLRVSATCVRVPVLRGHSMVLHAVLERPVDLDAVRQALVEAPNIVVLDDPVFGDFPTPSDAVGSDPVFVGRLRRCLDDDHAVELFVCADNLRAGLALPALQVAELVLAQSR